ncbi:tail fiber domain-containing protein [Aequorivita sp. SDUM287046]|uniref:Tail fiber domain-containing protein n=1 Tax=Aequorivita aurantiaca TaxID=3053356 RepID=A0ABT8DQD5_9FLAO|nr:tail fiber domain-containing protein [Aequorivita aurantiaca]MDN3725272.1 tail fiber domain-containing protein [Aequorivita aurantiaca]
MKRPYAPQQFAFLICSLFLFFSYNVFGQVGIGTTNPDIGSILDITSNDKGVLLPRIDITNLNNLLPLTSGTEGMIVYNTNTSTGPGLVYWNGVNSWVPVGDGNGTDSWGRTGNAGTTGTNFIGTTDNQPLRFKTANTNAFEISGGPSVNRGRLRAMNNGDAALPTYSWNGANAQNMGMFRISANTLGFSTNGTERARIIANGDVGVGTVNPLARLNVSIAENDRPAIFSQITATNSTWSAGEFFNPNNAGGIGLMGIGYSGVYGVTTNVNAGWAGYFEGDVFTRDLYFRDVYTYSDRRVKQNFQNIDNSLDIIMKLNPQKYEKLIEIDNSKTTNFISAKGTMEHKGKAEKEFGLIAQEVELILPELVSTKETILKDLGAIDLKAVNYNGLIPILIQAMQEQQVQIKVLEEEVKILKAKN